MKELQKKVGKTIIIVSIIMALTLSNFLAIGMEFISYAVGDIEVTNENNVLFKAIFIDSNGEEHNTIESSMKDENIKLRLVVQVEKVGYFNGEIQIHDSNFKLKTDIENKYINNISENYIKLNHINAGEEAIIDIDIEIIKDEQYQLEFLNKVSKVQILGMYATGENSVKQISSERELQLKLNPEILNKILESTANIVTNEVYEINGENKRVIQLEVALKASENDYPIKETILETDVLDGVEKVEVAKRGTYATNNNKRELESSWNKDTNKINVTISNSEENGKVEWNKNGNDKILITYILSEDKEVENKKILVKSKIEYYDENSTTIESEIETIIEEKKDGAINYELKGQNELYKGYLYYGEESKVETKTEIDIRLKGIVNTIKVDEGNAKYLDENAEYNANLQYYLTKVNKEDVKRILGETGNLEIKTKEGEILSTINKGTISEIEEENIEIQYEEQNEIIIEITNAENEGKLVFEHKQKILEDANIKETMKEISKIKINGILELDEKVKTNEKIIELKEPETYAKITSNTNVLSTLQTNENVEFNVILKTDDIKYELYKNPTIEVQLPKEITNITATFNTVFLDGLQVKEANIYDTSSGNKAMKIELEGEQTKHLNNISEGIILNINANIDVLKTVNTKDTEIKLLYTNENSEADVYEQNLPIKLKSKEGLLVYNKIENYNSKGDVIETEGTKTINETIEKESNGKEINANTSLVNNYEEEIEDVTIIGKNSDNTTMDLNIVKSIEVNKDSEVYYSEDGENWTKNVDEIQEVKAYKIETSQIPSAESMELKYDFKLPEQLEYNQIGKIEQNVTYTYHGQELSQNFGLQLRTQNAEIEPTTDLKESHIDEVTGKLEVETTTRLGLVDINAENKVHEGETLKNIIKILNKTGKDIKNVKVKVNQKNAVLYDLKEKKVINNAVSDEPIIEHSFEELETGEKTFDTIETIKSGEIIQLAYEVVINEVEGTDKETYGEIEITADDMENVNATTIHNKIEQGELKINSKFALNEEVKQYSNFTAPTIVNISNISGKEMEEINVSIQLGQLEMENVEDIEFCDADLNDINMSNIRNLKYVDVNKEITFTIYKLSPSEQLKVILNTKASKIPFDKLEALAGIVTIATTKENNIYTSNVALKKTIQTAKDITVKQESDIKNGNSINNNDTFNIKITVENNTNKENKLNIENNMNNMLKINNVKMNNGKETIEIDKKHFEEGNVFNYDFEIGAKSKIEFILNVTAKSKGEDEEVTCETIISYPEDTEYEDIHSNKLEFLIKAYIISDDEDNNDDNNEDNNGNNNDTNKTKEYEISGVAWLDKDKNGKMDSNEEKLSGITVRLANKSNGEIIKNLDTTTDKNGKYTFKVKNGEYIVIFQYDTKKYNLTEYKKTSVSDTQNSDVISKNLKIDNKDTMVGITDTIKVSNKNVSNISIGLVEKEIFDLKLDKTVSKISIQNKQGTTIRQYNNEKLAKLEIKAKYYKGSAVTIEYKIVVTNEGEVEGYANDIVDYIPSNLKFNTELNKNWYLGKDGNLHNTSISNQKIQPGETKELTLILTKTLDENDGGLISNTAEIYRSSNDKNIQDIDSKAGNKIDGEDDISTAGVIVSIGTGIVKICLITIFVILVIVAIVVFIIKRKGGELIEKTEK